MKGLLKNFKKSEVAIYTIAIMLVAAGYLNYTTMHKEENVQEVSLKQQQEENIGDARLVNSEEVVKKDENSVEQEKIETNNDETDYFVNSKLNRDTNYASMISSYTAIIEKEGISETEKKTAMKKIDEINNTKNTIMICENLLSTKGFKDNVVLKNDKSINIVVKTEKGLSKEKVAQIQNIILREFKTDISNIHITEKK